jgi:hypothetical protein
MNQLLGTINPNEKIASMNEVVMKKEELLKVLIENKAKHDTIYDAAVVGYWDAAKDRLTQKRKELSTALKEFGEDVDTQFSRLSKKIEAKEVLPYSIAVRGLQWATNLDLVFPENHTKDYERAIRMMQASIYDEVRLSEQEFDSYVLNNWDWKEKFIASNTFYVNNFRTKGLKLTTGFAGPQGATGPAGLAGYANAREEAIGSLAVSGCAIL